jgi:hypothetical protein
MQHLLLAAESRKRQDDSPLRAAFKIATAKFSVAAPVSNIRCTGSPLGNAKSNAKTSRLAAVPVINNQVVHVRSIRASAAHAAHANRIDPLITSGSSKMVKLLSERKALAEKSRLRAMHAEARVSARFFHVSVTRATLQPWRPFALRPSRYYVQVYRS